MGSTPDTDFTLTIPAAANHGYTVAVQVFRGVNTTTALDVTTTTSTGTASVLADPPAATAPNTAVNCLVLIGSGAHNAAAQTFSASYLNNFISTGYNASTADSTIGMGYLRNIYTAYNGAAWTFSGADNAGYSYACAALVLRAA